MLWLRPSFFGFILNGLLIALFIYYYFSRNTQINDKEMAGFILLFSIAVGVHTILHYYEETFYQFNPFNFFYESNKISQDPLTTRL